MAKAGVTYDDVAAAAEQLAATGASPTVKAIRSILGSGSSTTILRELQAWKASKENPSERLELSPSIANAIAGEIERVSAAVRAECEREIEELQNNLADVAAEAEELTAQVSELSGTLDSERSDNLQLLGRAEELEREVARQRDEITHARHTLDEALTRAAVVPSLEKQLQDALSRLEKEHAARIDAEKKLAVTEAELSGEVLARQRAESQLDRFMDSKLGKT